MLDNLRCRASNLVDVGASPSALKCTQVLMFRRLRRGFGAPGLFPGQASATPPNSGGQTNAP
jgi:hypothetical protein